MDCPGLLSFPNEVLSLIFDSIVTLRDLHNLKLTCRRFLEVIRKSNNFWKLKLKVNDTLQRMSSVCYPLGEIPLDVMDNLVIGPIPEMVEEILREKIFHKELNENLTIKYYAKKMLLHVRTRSLEKMLSEWISLEFQPLLEGAILISQYGQMMEEEDLPSLRSKVEINLENITNQVNAALIVDKSDVTHKEKKILACIRQVMFVEMGFQKPNMESWSSLENFYIDKVLERKTGHVLILSIIYREVARRLGITAVEFVFSNTNGGRLLHLRWSEFENEYTCLTLAGGDLNYPCNNPANVYSVVPVHKVFKWICGNLIECCEKQNIERDRETDRKLGSGYAFRFLYVLRLKNLIHFRRLACTIFPDANTALRYAKTVRACHPLCGIQVEEAIHFLRSNEAFVRSSPQRSSYLNDCLLNQIKAKNFFKEQIKRRTPSTKFAVGLVVIYTSVDTGAKVVGVIDSRTESFFHHVLLEGGDSDMLPEFDLELHPSGIVVNHPLIGLHFERFNGRRYIPNAEMQNLFPDDEAYASSLVG